LEVGLRAIALPEAVLALAVLGVGAGGGAGQARGLFVLGEGRPGLSRPEQRPRPGEEGRAGGFCRAPFFSRVLFFGDLFFFVRCSMLSKLRFFLFLLFWLLGRGRRLDDGTRRLDDGDRRIDLGRRSGRRWRLDLGGRHRDGGGLGWIAVEPLP